MTQSHIRMNHDPPDSVEEEVPSAVDEDVSSDANSPREVRDPFWRPRYMVHVGERGEAVIHGLPASNKGQIERDFHMNIEQEGKVTLFNSGNKQKQSSIFNAFGLPKDIATQSKLMIASKKKYRARRQVYTRF